MQAERITKKILEESANKVVELQQQTKQNVNAILEEAKNYCKKLEDETGEKLKKLSVSLQEKLETMQKIDGNKILLEAKQNCIKNAKLFCTNYLENLSQKEMLVFVDRIILKNASKNDKVLFCIKDISTDQVKKLESVKKPGLEVEQAEINESGIILSNSNFDKNLTFSSIVEEFFEENSKKIKNILL